MGSVYVWRKDIFVAWILSQRDINTDSYIEQLLPAEYYIQTIISRQYPDKVGNIISRYSNFLLYKINGRIAKEALLGLEQKNKGILEHWKGPKKP